MRCNREHLSTWNPAPPPREDPTSITSVTASIALHRRQWRSDLAFTFWVAVRSTPTHLIGRVALTGVMRGAMQGAYLGYWVDRQHLNRGYATEAIEAVCRFGFGTAGLHRIQAAIMPNNARSLRVIEKLGFRREGYAERYLQIAGTWEDHCLFAQTSEEPPMSP